MSDHYLPLSLRTVVEDWHKRTSDAIKHYQKRVAVLEEALRSVVANTGEATDAGQIARRVLAPTPSDEETKL